MRRKIQGIMESQQIKKLNVGYLLFYIFIPLVVGAIFTALSFWALQDDTVAMMVMVIVLCCIFWWSLCPGIVYNNTRKKYLAELDARGFIRNYTFKGDGCTVAVNLQNGQIAMIFKWNPRQYFVLPANHITNLWVDDGKMLGGSSRVSFLFILDGVKVRVNTFTSNRVWSMKSNYIVEGISKANIMVENLRQASAAANAALF